MKKLHEKVWMSNETSTAEERLEIVKLAKELGYDYHVTDLDDRLDHVNNFCYLEYYTKINKFLFCTTVSDEAKPVTHQQMLEIFANNEEDHSAVYRALSKVRGLHRLPKVGKTTDNLIVNIVSDHIVNANEKIKPITISEAVDQLKQACKAQGITIEVLKFQMPS